MAKILESILVASGVAVGMGLVFWLSYWNSELYTMTDRYKAKMYKKFLKLKKQGKL